MEKKFANASRYVNDNKKMSASEKMGCATMIMMPLVCGALLFGLAGYPAALYVGLLGGVGMLVTGWRSVD